VLPIASTTSRARRRDEGVSDADLMARVGAGDLAALGDLYDRHHASVLRFVNRLTGRSPHADDLAHETFLMLARRAKRYDGRPSARPWLLGIAARLVRQHRRSAARLTEVLLSFRRSGSDSPPPTPEAAASVTEEMRRFDQALRRLSEEKRAVILLVEVEGLSGEEVARALEIPLNTVWTRLHYARKELREALSP
jgi:RNA polymerase sigma-70 factor (ECF subfamily)